MKSNFESLTSWAQEIERRDDLKSDFVASTDMLHMPDDHTLAIEGVDSFKASENFNQQVGTHYGIPMTYMNAMSEIPGLKSHNVNEWFKHSEEKRFVRTLEGNARAFLSDKFRPLDHAFVLQALLPVLKEHKDLEVKSQALTDSRFYLQLVFPRLSAEVVVGDTMWQGITISNSEVGRGALDIASLMWRLQCLNGMVGESIMSRRHVGSRLEFENGDIFQHDTIKAELESYRLRLRDVVHSALDEASFAERINLLKAANEETFSTKKVNKVVENVTKRFNQLSKGDGENLLSSLIEGQNFSKYGLANAVTALAHNTESPDKAYDFERVGAMIIELKPSEWSAVTAA